MEFGCQLIIEILVYFVRIWRVRTAELEEYEQ